MKFSSFKGGVHPNDNKLYTNSIPIVDMPPSKELYFPLKQHIGQECLPIVKVGEHVTMGQVLGKSEHALSVPIHSSVSGIVKEIKPYLHPSGAMVNTVVVENDFNDIAAPPLMPHGDVFDISRKDIIKLVQEAGIVGLGGAGFPTYIKLSPPPDKKIKNLIINGAECEPYLTSDHRVMLEDTATLIKGLKVIMKLFGLKKGYIAVEENKADAIGVLKSVTETDPRVEIRPLRVKYPQGSEKHLIKAVLDIEVPSKKLPLDVGALVINIDTCCSIARAIEHGSPLLTRIITVSGACVKEPKNLKVRIGTPISHVFDECDGFSEDPVKIIMGGPMMGLVQYSTAVPVIKTTSALLALSKKEVAKEKEAHCIRCSKCINACPMRLMPVFLSDYASKKDIENLKKYHVSDCIECGSCCFVCPSRRHLTQNIRNGKNLVRQS